MFDRPLIFKISKVKTIVFCCNGVKLAVRWGFVTLSPKPSPKPPYYVYRLALVPDKVDRPPKFENFDKQINFAKFLYIFL